jgi:hypothetical protein
MAYANPSFPSSPVYRPRKIPRFLRRQLPAVWILGVLATIGLLAVAVTWRNLTHEKLSLDTGHQRIEIQQLNKEIDQLTAQVQTEASYARISRWVHERHGRWSRTDHVNTVKIADSELSPQGRKEARLLGASGHE